MPSLVCLPSLFALVGVAFSRWDRGRLCGDLNCDDWPVIDCSAKLVRCTAHPLEAALASIGLCCLLLFF